MPAIAVRPQRSRQYLAVIVVLHALLLFVVCMLFFAWQWWLLVLGCGVSAVWTLHTWWRSADCELDIRPDHQTWLRLQDADPMLVGVAEGGWLSKWLIVAYWHNDEQQRFCTVVWRDSVDSHTFKLLYVWLRWQPQQHGVRRKWHN